MLPSSPFLISILLCTLDIFSSASRSTDTHQHRRPLLHHGHPGLVPDDAYDVPPGHEEMLFYRGFAHRDAERGWVAQMRGVLIKRASPMPVAQRGLVRGFQVAFPPDNTQEDLRTRNRLSYFFADTLGDKYDWFYGIKNTDTGEALRALRIAKDGSFQSNTTLLNSSRRPGDVVELAWQPPHTNTSVDAVQVGRVHLYGSEGFSIYADIDDTIKDSRVIVLPKLLHQTFLETYEPVPYMPEVFQHFKRTLATKRAPDVAFHYISSTPYSLLRPLDHFIANRTFPLGPIHLEELRVKEPKTVFTILQQTKFKLQEARRIVQTYPRRKLILMGDSAQFDAKAFGTLMREDPEGKHYQCSFIRLVSGVNEKREKKKNRRSVFEDAFKGVDASRYYMFTDARELMTIDIAGGSCKPAGKADSDIGTFSDD